MGMTNSARQDIAREIDTIAKDIAAAYAADELDDAEVARMDSDAGLEVDGYAVWLNRDRNAIVVWAGNEHDENMDWPAEVHVTPR